MSSDRDITGVVRSWLQEDAHEDADRVLFSVLGQVDKTPQRRAFWSVRSLFVAPSSMRLVAAVAAGVAVVALGLLFTRPNVGIPLPSERPSGSPSHAPAAPSASPLPALSETFTSAIHGYSISYPAGWTVRPATEPWPMGFAAQDDRAFQAENDHFASHIRDTMWVASQPIPHGSTFDDWLSGYLDGLHRDELPLGCGGASPTSTWTAINIGGQRGLRWMCGYDSGGAVVAVGGRVYVFRAQTRLLTLVEGIDGGDPTRYLAPQLFLAMLATLQFDPASAADAP